MFYLNFAKFMKFVLINGRVLDFDEYKRDVKLLAELFTLDLKHYFAQHGFVPKSRNKQRKQLRQQKQQWPKVLKQQFYNPQLDLEIAVTVRKKSKDVFV